MSELERVLQQVSNRRKEQVAVGIDGKQGIHRSDRQHAFLDLRFKGG
jgi:hypothetical protein